MDGDSDPEYLAPEIVWTYDELSRAVLENSVTALRGLVTILDASVEESRTLASIIVTIADSITLANMHAEVEEMPVYAGTDGLPH